MITRRAFAQALALQSRPEYILIHEHVLVDFIGAERVSPARYDRDEVARAALPHLAAVRARGCKTLVECTPAYLGRDPVLLQRLSKASGVELLTNTGYYGAANDKHVPAHAFKESPDQLAARWTAEYRNGIEGTGVRPSFIKTGVDAGPLSEIDRKLIVASALCHRDTGLRIHAHTGNGVAALAILDVLDSMNIPRSAYVWVHAQNEKDVSIHEQAAKRGAWLEFDGINARTAEWHLRCVKHMIDAGYTGQVLISQDSGWYRVGEPGGGQFNGYTYLFDSFIPALRDSGVEARSIRRLLVENPTRVLQRKPD